MLLDERSYWQKIDDLSIELQSPKKGLKQVPSMIETIRRAILIYNAGHTLNQKTQPTYIIHICLLAAINHRGQQSEPAHRDKFKQVALLLGQGGKTQ